jgi:hypothetical protein
MEIEKLSGYLVVSVESSTIKTFCNNDNNDNPRTTTTRLATRNIL